MQGTLLSRKRSSLDKLLRERDDFKKAYVARMEDFKASIGSLRADIQRLEDGDDVSDEEQEEIMQTRPLDNNAGIKPRAGDSATDEEEEPGFQVPTRGMFADAIQGVKSPVKSHREPSPSQSGEDRPQLAVRGMVADSEEASLGLNDNARPVPPGFESRAQATASRRNGTAELAPRGSRDLSPSPKSSQSSPTTAPKKLPGPEPSLLPRPLRHKAARPVQQIYVPPRNRLSNGNLTSAPEKESRPKSAQLPVGVRISMEPKREDSRPPASDRTDESSEGGPLDRENFFPTLNGRVVPASSPLRSAEESTPQRVPISQRLTVVGSAEQSNAAWNGALAENGNNTSSHTPIRPPTLAMDNVRQPAKWSALVGDQTETGSPKVREWDANKPDDPQAATLDASDWKVSPNLTGNWADTEVQESASPAAERGGLALKGAWGQGNARDRIRDSSNLTRLGAVPSRLGSVWGNAPADGNVVARERDAGLRHPGDEAPDEARKKQMKSDRNLQYFDSVGRREVNILEGLELHHPVLDGAEQEIMRRVIEEWCRMGMNGELKGRTFSAPRKWAKGKGRITIQFGCCYNYAVDRQGRAPGIIAEEVVEPMPRELVALAQRLVRWGIIPRDMEPDSAIVNIYEVEDCIPPHIDHHDFSRPFCTISLLSEESIMFGQRLVPEGPGEFHGTNGRHTLISLPKGSCLVLNGNGADLAMHCVPPVRNKRMSITLRRMGAAHAKKVTAQLARSRVNFDAFHPNASPEPERPPERNSVNIMDLVKWK